MKVAYHRAARQELAALPKEERLALLHAVEKLQALGERLPFPHCSAVKQSRLWELRPRGGRSPWRALYSRTGQRMVIWAVGPDAKKDTVGFRRAVLLAEQRIGDTEGTQEGE